MREGSDHSHKVPWWAYHLFAALLAPLALMAWWLLSMLKLMLGWPLETPLDWYATAVFAVFGGLLLWYVIMIAWRVFRKPW